MATTPIIVSVAMADMMLEVLVEEEISSVLWLPLVEGGGATVSWRVKVLKFPVLPRSVGALLPPPELGGDMYKCYGVEKASLRFGLGSTFSAGPPWPRGG